MTHPSGSHPLWRIIKIIADFGSFVTFIALVVTLFHPVNQAALVLLIMSVFVAAAIVAVLWQTKATISGLRFGFIIATLVLSLVVTAAAGYSLIWPSGSAVTAGPPNPSGSTPTTPVTTPPSSLPASPSAASPPPVTLIIPSEDPATISGCVANVKFKGTPLPGQTFVLANRAEKQGSIYLADTLRPIETTDQWAGSMYLGTKNTPNTSYRMYIIMMRTDLKDALLSTVHFAAQVAGKPVPDYWLQQELLPEQTEATHFGVHRNDQLTDCKAGT